MSYTGTRPPPPPPPEVVPVPVLILLFFRQPAPGLELELMLGPYERRHLLSDRSPASVIIGSLSSPRDWAAAEGEMLGARLP